MKKVFIFLMVVMTMMVVSGCRHNSETESTTVESVDYVYRTEFEGHKYIMFKQNGWHNDHNVTGVVHDPDCPCYSK